MADREKVMQWLKTCASGCEDGCPYEYKNLVYRVECKADLMRDALELLKEQNNCENCAIAIENRQPVVRCQDCKHRFNGCCYDKKSDRINFGVYVADDWFCADGERR